MAKIENKTGMTNVFAYAAREEARWMTEMMAWGYDPKTTFYSDFSIADFYGDASIKDTYKRATKEWIKNLEYGTELVMVLNHKCWEWYDKGNHERSALYADLYEKAYDLLRKAFQKDEAALSYIFRTLD